MSYKFLEHTADVKFVAEGSSVEDVFVESAMALKDSICGDIVVLEQEKKELSIKGDNLENLLYKFLEESLFLLDSVDFLLSKVQSIKINLEDFSLQAVVSGDKAENYKFTNDVKAVTYNEMFVKFDETKNIWEAQVVLDV